MKCGLPTSPRSVVPRKSRILRPTLIGEVVRSVGQSSPYHCRNGLDHVVKPPFAPPQSFFRPLAVGDIHVRADHLNHFACYVHHGMTDGVDVFNASIGKDGPEHNFVRYSVTNGSLEDFCSRGSIIRMYTRAEGLEMRNAFLGVES